MNRKKELALSISCLFLAFLCSMIWLRERRENLAASISPEILRFHILANSNSPGDQELKLEIKSLILDALSDSGADSKEAFCNYVSGHQAELKTLADRHITAKGYPYQAQISLTSCYFPTKSYGDLTLPCGIYDAVQIKLGEARGRNWWCVLYPRLCFIDATHAALPDSSKEQLRAVLPAETCKALLGAESLPCEIQISLRSAGIAHKFLRGRVNGE